MGGPPICRFCQLLMLCNPVMLHSQFPPHNNPPFLWHTDLPSPRCFEDHVLHSPTCFSFQRCSLRWPLWGHRVEPLPAAAAYLLSTVGPLRSCPQRDPNLSLGCLGLLFVLLSCPMSCRQPTVSLMCRRLVPVMETALLA